MTTYRGREEGCSNKGGLFPSSLALLKSPPPSRFPVGSRAKTDARGLSCPCTGKGRAAQVGGKEATVFIPKLKISQMLWGGTTRISREISTISALCPCALLSPPSKISPSLPCFVPPPRISQSLFQTSRSYRGAGGGAELIMPPFPSRPTPGVSSFPWHHLASYPEQLLGNKEACMKSPSWVSHSGSLKVSRNQGWGSFAGSDAPPLFHHSSMCRNHPRRKRSPPVTACACESLQAPTPSPERWGRPRAYGHISGPPLLSPLCPQHPRGIHCNKTCAKRAATSFVLKRRLQVSVGRAKSSPCGTPCHKTRVTVPLGKIKGDDADHMSQKR